MRSKKLLKRPSAARKESEILEVNREVIVLKMNSAYRNCVGKITNVVMRGDNIFYTVDFGTISITFGYSEVQLQ